MLSEADLVAKVWLPNLLQLDRFEHWRGMKRNSLHVDTRYNIMRRESLPALRHSLAVNDYFLVDGNMHYHFDHLPRFWLLLPTADEPINS